jgi:hypothetical protein
MQHHTNNSFVAYEKGHQVFLFLLLAVGDGYPHPGHLAGLYPV